MESSKYPDWLYIEVDRYLASKMPEMPSEETRKHWQKQAWDRVRSYQKHATESREYLGLTAFHWPSETPDRIRSALGNTRSGKPALPKMPERARRLQSLGIKWNDAYEFLDEIESLMPRVWRREAARPDPRDLSLAVPGAIKPGLTQQGILSTRSIASGPGRAHAHFKKHGKYPERKAESETAIFEDLRSKRFGIKGSR